MKILHLFFLVSILIFSCASNTADNEGYTEEYEASTLIKPGESVSGVSLTTLSGDVVNIDSLKGKTVFLNFFTLSCPMCMLELPQLEKQIWDKYKNRDDFVILTIGREHTNAELSGFYKKKQFTFPMAADTDRSVYAKFAEKFVPRNIIIDKEGEIAYTAIGYSEEEGLDELLDAIKKQIGEYNYAASEKDIDIYESIITFAEKNKLNSQKLSKIEIEVAKQLLNIPYVAHTLEQKGEENLVINLQGLDCTTFLENVVAISSCIKSGKTSFKDYCDMLVKIRYRDGKINQYPSRLHYFTDWLLDNEKKGIIKIVSNDFGNADFNPQVGFMSENADKYKHLANNQKFVDKVAQQENIIAQAKLKYVTKDNVENVADKIKDGDLIAYTTTIGGLDVSHVAIAAFHNNRLHFYHASSLQKKVVLSAKPISEYLADKKKNDGILVARIVE